MTLKYQDLKPSRYLFNYDNLFKTLKDKNITLNQMKKDLNIANEEINKISRHELTATIKQMAEYLDTDYIFLYDITGKYDDICSNDFSVKLDAEEKCDELLRKEYQIKYCYYKKENRFKIEIYGMGYQDYVYDNDIALGVIDIYYRLKNYEETGMHPSITD